MSDQRTLPSILSLGSINADFQVKVDRWPDPGETLLARDLLMIGGGKAANVAYLARRVGVPAVLIARLGDDFLAGIALEDLQRSGVDLSHVRRVDGATTGLAMISVRADGDKAILLASNANASWQERDAEEAVAVVRAAPEGSVLVTDLEIPVFVVERAAAAARERRLKVVLDPSPAERMTQHLYQCADVITPNRSEAQQLSGRTIEDVGEAEEAAELLQHHGSGSVVLKLAGECVLCEANGSQRLSSIGVEAVDTTGAGDAFAATLAIGLMEGRHLRDAVLLAMAASSIAIQSYGSQPAYPDRAQLDARVSELAAANRA